MSYYITHSGIRIDPTNITPEDINLHDIAHHLTKICRYGGALDLGVHYSVAQHSIRMANKCRDLGYYNYISAMVLLHDASEAYLGDIVTGLKQVLPEYRELERSITDVILRKYTGWMFASELGRQQALGIADQVIAQLDKRIVLDEALAFKPHQYQEFAEQLPGLEPLGITLHPEKDLRETYYLFLWWCEKLGIKD